MLIQTSQGKSVGQQHINEVCSLQCFKEILRNISEKIFASISVISLDVRIITDTGYRYEAAHLQTLSYLNVLPGHLTSAHLL